MKCSKSVFVICISALLLCSCSGPSFHGANSRPVTVILGAFDEEVKLLQNQLADRQEQKIESIRFTTGKLHNRNVVVAWTGMGKVSAAMTATLAIEHFRPGELIFTGIAGGVNPELLPGDIVIAEKTAQHDLGTLTPKGLENEGFVNPVTGEKNPVFFPADRRLLKLAEQASNQVKLDKVRTSMDERSPRIMMGVVVTGDIFVASTAKCAELRERLGADAVEMEGAAVAQICWQEKVPYLVIRSISDNADEKALEDLDRFYKMAAKNSAALVIKMVELLETEAPEQAGMEKNLRD